MKQILVSVLALATTLLLSTHAFAVKKSAVAAKPASELKLDTKTSVIKWTGRKVVGPHTGTLNLKDGSVMFKGKQPTAGSFTIDMTTIKDEDLKDAEYNKKLVTHLSSDDFFAVAKHPTAEFKITKSTLGKEGDVFLTGDLTIKGITKSITFPAKITEDNGVYVAKGTLKFNRTDFDLKYNSGKFFDPKVLGDKLIYDDIEVELELKTLPVGA